MARRGHTAEGKIYCSECGSGIESGSDNCEHCSEALIDDFEAIICPYCTTVVPAESGSCTNCGLKFVSEKKGRAKEDDEFLSKLLEWGKNLEAKRIQEDKQETETATNIFKDVVGSITPTPFQEETLKQIKQSADERDEFEKREESILKMAEPLKKALDLRKKALDDLEIKFKSLQGELENLSPEDLDSDRKRSDLERQLAEIIVERSTINNLEDNINNMDSAYRQLLKQHSAEIQEKEEKLNTRLSTFKKEMERRETEKEKLKTREEFLETKEKELVARINSLRERENSLKRTEDEMKREIATLKAEKEGVEELKKPIENYIATKGKWIVDEGELINILKKSKKVRDDWLDEQRKIQEAMDKDEPAGIAAAESGERLDGREQELQKKIGELEKKLAETISEEQSLKREEKEIGIDMERLKKVLKVLDDLLENLPEDVVENFAKSENYKEYDELMQELGL
ncbi:MAG: zinc ribbon domain-containing protein [Thermoplasmata archaeon]|nr:zinc ribbon domain-containing protein [Thermoplasmata archaeon]